MRFRDQPTTWEALPGLLARVPDRAHTVLELAVGSDEITVAAQNQLVNRVTQLARQHGFEYASFVGIHAPDAESAAESGTVASGGTVSVQE